MVTGTTETTVQATVKAEDKTPATDKGLEGKVGGAERTYRQAEVDALLGRAGQKVQTKLSEITGERDSFKSQLDSLTSEITEARESIESLTKDIEAMSEDNPDKHASVRLRKEKEAELKAAKAERTKVTGEVAETLKEINQWKRDQLVYTVADEYVTATGEKIDMDNFKSAADRLKRNEREELEAMAEIMGYRIKVETPEKKETLTPYSGITQGGSNMPESAKDKIRAGWDKIHK